MRFTVSLKENRQFKRLYSAGKSAVDPNLAVYFRKNRLPGNQLGITVGTKVGGAVVRNRVRRRIREAYRLMEAQLRPGYDIVVVARARAAECGYQGLDRSLRGLFTRLGLLRREPAPPKPAPEADKPS